MYANVATDLRKQSTNPKVIVLESESIKKDVISNFRKGISESDIEETIKGMDSWLDRFDQDEMYETLISFEKQSENDNYH